MVLRKLIINADDFGKNKSINDAIAYCFRHKLITDTNLMVNMPGTQAAVKLMIQKKLPVGIHIALTSDFDFINTPAVTKCPSLTDQNGYFKKPTANNDFWEKEINSWNLKEVKDEIYAQYDLYCKLTKSKPTHITSHHHIHAHRRLLPIFISLAEEKNIPIRLPILKAKIPTKKTLVKIRKKVCTTDFFITEYKGTAKCASFGTFIRSFKKQPCGTVELMVHPGMPSNDSEKIYNKWWQRELSMLKSRSFAKLLKNKNVILFNYKRLQEECSNHY